MSDPILPPEAEALDQYLSGHQTTPLPPDEAALAEALLAAAMVEPDPAFAAALEKQLATKAQRKPQPTRAAAFNPFLWSDSMRKFSAFAVTTVLIVGLLAGGVWLSTRLQPGELPNPGISVTELATQFLLDYTQTPQPSSTPEPTATPSLELQPDLAFPDGPTGAILYRQLPLEALTVDNAKQLAAQLGIDGHVYQSSGEGGPSQTIYEVTDGTGNVRFIGSPGYFNLTPDEYHSFVITGQALPFEERASIAEAFLKSIGLLDFDYVLEPSIMSHQGVVVTRLLDGYRLMFDQVGDSNNSVTVSANGEVQSVLHYMPEFEALGLYPIISAREAWEVLNTPSARRGVSSSSSFTMLDADYRVWTPEYAPGEQVDLYGYPVAFQSAEPGRPPMISINNLKILDGTEALAAATAPGQFMHVWGVHQPDGFQLEGWEVATQADDFLRGTLEREGDTAYLAVSEQRYILSRVPSSVPNGIEVEVRGVKLNESEFSWTTINTPTEGGGGGGGGGNVFAEVALTPVADLPTPTPYPYPYSIGDAVDGLSGLLNVTVVDKTDGSLELWYTMWADSSGQYWAAQLKGSVAGLDQLHNLPVRVWGQVSGINNDFIEITIERYEEVYPGLRLQSWLGTQEVVTLEGRKAVLFTQADGQQFVLANSVRTSEDFVNVTGRPGDLTIVDGYAPPGKTFGGYPLIQDLSSSIANSGDELSAHINSIATPYVQSEDDIPADSLSFLSDDFVIEQVELAYLASDFTHGWPPPPDDCACRIVQPMWRFSGHMRDGEAFALIVQALTEEYLKPVP